MLNHPEDVWAADIPAIAAATARSVRSAVHLHPPKTGGSTFQGALRTSPGWDGIEFPSLWRTTNPCSCSAGCRDAPRPPLSAADLPESGGSLLLGVHHVTYAEVCWLRETLAQHGGRVDVTFMTVRPTRQRLVSIFRDYWTEVRIAEEYAQGAPAASPHRATVVRSYAADSRHYLRPDGSIDGTSWFRAFSVHGSGSPFFMREVFDDPQTVRDEIDTGRLTLVPSSQIDAVLTDLTGSPPKHRVRVSAPIHPEAVAAALDDASDLIDELARRDDEYEWMSDNPVAS